MGKLSLSKLTFIVFAFCAVAVIASPATIFTSLVSFDVTHGSSPYNVSLIQGTDGNFYGTTFNAGTGGYGTVFKITPAGTLTTLHNFGGADGGNPVGGLAQATNGAFYGTTANLGPNGRGTIFKITPAGTLITLYNFNGTDGGNPVGGLAQATNGTLYGTTNQGGADNNCAGGCGTVFSLSVGLGPFVETLPTSGKVGAKVIILGNNLTGTTSVTFNGRASSFTVDTSTEITTTVPTGATTGAVKVTTPNKTLKSNVGFRVTK
jgi:uncharacterized repeat protein (TIGR03803 family)